MMDDTKPQDPRALLRLAGLKAKKSWGQNFLCDQNILRLIAKAAQAPGDQPVVELGAGLGALTWHLLGNNPVVAVERDRELVPHLRRHLEGRGQLRVLEADAGRLDYHALRQEMGAPLTVAGNLPYQLSSRILVSLADAGPSVQQAVFLVQREVAERLGAKPPGRDYGLLSVLVQRSFSVEILQIVPPGAFFPPPKVHSAVVRLTREPNTRSALEDQNMVRAARAGFSARRKTLRNALAGACRVAGAEAEELLHSVGIAPSARAESLSLDDFARLGAGLAARGWLTPTEESAE